MKTNKYLSGITYSFISLLVVLLTACGGGGDNKDTGNKKPTFEHPGLYFVDVHTQVSPEVELNNILTQTSANNVAKSILSARGGLSSTDITDFAQQNPDKIVAMIKVKGRAYSDNSPSYFTTLQSRADSGLYGAIGEVMIYHAEKRNGAAPEVKVPLTDDRVTAALNVAKTYGWPLILHIEFASLSNTEFATTLQALNTFLTTHASHPIALIHMGQLESNDVETLLSEHSNVFFITSHSNPVSIASSNQPWTNMFSGDSLAPEWERLLLAYPDRLIFALDNVWPEHWEADHYARQIATWKKALTYIPPEVVKVFAHGNAERLWGIK